MSNELSILDNAVEKFPDSDIVILKMGVVGVRTPVSLNVEDGGSGLDLCKVICKGRPVGPKGKLIDFCPRELKCEFIFFLEVTISKLFWSIIS